MSGKSPRFPAALPGLLTTARPDKPPGVIVCRTLEELASQPGPLHLALGVFDGVHIGHQEVLRRATAAAGISGGTAGLVTFDPHPIRVIAPGKAPASLLASLEHKAEIVSTLGADLFAPLHFDETMARMTAEAFLGKLLRAPVATIAVGEDWRFGHNREGDVELLRAAAERQGFRLEAVLPVMADGERVSSTRIRQAIRDGNLDAARNMLGRPYSITGHVAHGRKLGRTLGFPTANLPIDGHQLPPAGVWAVRIAIPDSGTFEGVANLGSRPTFEESGTKLEVHIFDFSGNLYGQMIDVSFVRHLRDERKFSSPGKLAEAIKDDVAAAREIFGQKI